LQQFPDKSGYQLLLGSLAHLGRANGVHRPVVGLAMRDESSDADNRVVDVLRKFVADRLAHPHIGLADKVVGGCKPAEVGHPPVSRSQTMTLGFMLTGSL
jgi:hypothetical protein